MGFRFSLAPLLRYRENLEDREHLLLQNIQQEIAGIRNQILGVEEQRQALMEECSGRLGQGLVASELHLFIGRKQQLEQAILYLHSKLAEAEERREQQREEYRLARQKREVLSTLRDRQLEAYRLEDGRRQQRGLDDMFLSRRKDK